MAIKREVKFSITFHQWIRANPPKETCHFELKQTPTDSIPFNCLEQQQLDYGTAIKSSPKGILMRNMGGNGEPDYSYLYRDPVFVAIKYPGFFCIILIEEFLKEKAVSKRQSLTGQRAQEISTLTVELKENEGKMKGRRSSNRR